MQRLKKNAILAGIAKRSAVFHAVSVSVAASRKTSLQSCYSDTEFSSMVEGVAELLQYGTTHMGYQAEFSRTGSNSMGIDR